VTSIRARISSVSLIAAIVTMMGGPLVAAAPHEMCDAMYHACDKIDALASCCCGDRSDNNPLRVPSGRAEVTGSHHAVVAVMPVVLPAIMVMFVREGPPALARPPDLPILFSDLRL
jgi:hypothetical protein